jgi:hypothetical protein
MIQVRIARYLTELLLSNICECRFIDRLAWAIIR